MLNKSLKTENRSEKWFWAKWVLILSVVFLIHLSTMGIAPFLHKDEFLIVDLGRIVLNPNTDWSIAWMANLNQPSFFLCYLGPVMQELSFQIVGQYGPRLSATAGALLAATLIVKWLISKNASPNLSLLLGLVFLLDPLFVQSYGLGRVDSWMMAFCIASCWIIASISGKLPCTGFFKSGLLLAGASFAVAIFIWPTAVFFVPLIVLELVCLGKVYYAINKSWKEQSAIVLYYAIGASLMSIILLLPISQIFFTPIYNLDGMETNIGVGVTKTGLELAWYSIYQFIEIFRGLKFTPVLVLVAGVYVIKQRQIGLVVALCCITIFLTFTKVYIHRVQYLLPYLIAAVAGIYSLSESRSNGDTFPFRKYFWAALLIWPIVLSVFARYILANDNPNERKRELVLKAAQSMIGPGNHGVFSSWEFYYPGRMLGWKMYVTYDAILSVEGLKPILNHIDYAIVPSNDVTNNIASLFEKEGLIERGNYYVYQSPRESDKQSNIQRLRLLFSIFRKPYGPYNIYVRDKNYNGSVLSKDLKHD